MVLWTRLAQKTWLGSLTAIPAPDSASIVAACKHPGLNSYREGIILMLEELRDTVGHGYRGYIEFMRSNGRFR